MTVTIHWATYCVAGNPKVNPTLVSRNSVWCAGWTRYNVNSPDEARRLFEECFPGDRIVSIS